MQEETGIAVAFTISFIMFILFIILNGRTNAKR